MHVLKIQDLNTIYVFLLLSNYARSLTQPLEKFLSAKSPLKEEFSTLMQNSFNWVKLAFEKRPFEQMMRPFCGSLDQNLQVVKCF